jgi:iron complex outermembrane receptor protein
MRSFMMWVLCNPEYSMSARVLAQAMGAATLLGISGSIAADEGLEPVVVTAQRREESAQSVGIAISVLSGQSTCGAVISSTNITT